ncbi:uncharacterized protein EV420DRAFT_1773058 [Desarmillaria tabescens]|uniref:Uncharacterized protein n=1 Tax=Armillaria tabescens TaxID=1929756 RepID=A0AA39MEF1_ARMTA|nr:uncharacterized protein EV420DRAFT_1773058 [Desarmillaria tabescens]KAK0431222.1 hypothetical protein EV420DRAFT_1773058 [Desarmillaria tabescens]
MQTQVATLSLTIPQVLPSHTHRTRICHALRWPTTSSLIGDSRLAAKRTPLRKHFFDLGLSPRPTKEADAYSISSESRINKCTITYK